MHAAEIYRRRVERLEHALDGDNPLEASEHMRNRIDHIEIKPRGTRNAFDAKLYGARAQILAICNEI